jgi:glycosyltransferase involved in cell wall biosynthesis
MKIMFAITKGEVGGAQEHLRILAHGLLERGNQVALVVTPGSALADSVKTAGAVIYPWRSISGGPSPLSNLAARRELRSAIEDWEPKVVHLYSSVAGTVGAGILRPPEGVTIFTCHHAAFGKGRTWRNRLLSRPAAQIAFPRMDGIISDGTRDLPAIRLISKKVPVAVVRNAVPFSGPPLSDGPLTPCALWVARLAEPKDPLMAVTAWEKVVTKMPGAMLTMCGTGPLERALRERVSRSPAAANIVVAGFVPDKEALLRAARVFLLVSKLEGGTTMATLEAMGQGLVPVITDVGDAYVLDENQSGVVVQSYDPGSIADAVVKVLSDPERFELLRRNAISVARGRSTADFVEETLDFYRRVEQHSDVLIL